MELKQVATVLWRWWWLLALAMLVSAAFSSVSDRQLPRVYRTSTTIQVGQFLQSTNPQPQDFATSQQLAQAYALTRSSLRREYTAAGPFPAALVRSNSPTGSSSGSASSGPLPFRFAAPAESVRRSGNSNATCDLCTLTRCGVLDNRASYKADMPTCRRRNRTSSRNGSHRRALQNAAVPLQDAAVDGHYSPAAGIARGRSHIVDRVLRTLHALDALTRATYVRFVAMFERSANDQLRSGARGRCSRTS